MQCYNEQIADFAISLARQVDFKRKELVRLRGRPSGGSELHDEIMSDEVKKALYDLAAHEAYLSYAQRGIFAYHATIQGLAYSRKNQKLFDLAGQQGSDAQQALDEDHKPLALTGSPMVPEH